MYITLLLYYYLYFQSNHYKTPENQFYLHYYSLSYPRIPAIQYIIQILTYKSGNSRDKTMQDKLVKIINNHNN